MSLLYVFSMAISILLQLSSFAVVVSCTSVHPRDPTITPPALLKRDADLTQDPNFIGYYLKYIDDEHRVTVESTYYTDSSGYAMTVNGNDVAWCPTTVADWQSKCASSSFYTTCSSNVLYASGTASTCSGTSSCGRYDVYTASARDESASVRWWTCANSSFPFGELYRVDPRTDAAFSDLEFYSASKTPASTTTISLSTTGSATISRSSPTLKPVSKGWITGAIIAGLGFLWAVQ